MRTVPGLYELYPGICFTPEEKALKNLSQGSRRMPVGTVKTEYTEQSIQTIRMYKRNNKNKHKNIQDKILNKSQCYPFISSSILQTNISQFSLYIPTNSLKLYKIYKHVVNLLHVSAFSTIFWGY
jgi:hypothetical protein